MLHDNQTPNGNAGTFGNVSNGGSMYEREVVCARCKKRFIAKTPNAKYCEPCRPFARAEINKNRPELESVEYLRERGEKIMRKYKGLDDKVKKLKAEGKTYAEAQKQDTINKYAHIEI